MAESVSTNSMAVIQPLEFPVPQDITRTTNTPTDASLLSEPLIQYDPTEEVALPQRLQPRPLFDAVQHASHLRPSVRSQLLHADACLYHSRTSEAITYLERGLLGCRQ